jgi:methylase of polypeptide subunit release factors
MSKLRGKRSSEWEFQGEVLKWLNTEIVHRPGMGLSGVTQEASRITPQRNDLVVWLDRSSDSAFLAIELKTPETPITSPGLLLDAESKARRWQAPFFAIWNMQSAELYKTPLGMVPATPGDRIHSWAPDPLVRSVDDWLKKEVARALQRRALEILDTAWSFHAGNASSIAIDASIFVERVALRIFRLRELVLPALAERLSRSRSLRNRVRALAAAAGFLDFVEDLHVAIAGQHAYRLIGQILFYHALRRRQLSLPPLEPEIDQPLPLALRPFWDNVRRFDYEALFQPSELDEIVPVPPLAEVLIRDLIKEFAVYNWNDLRDDVLGSIFEALIPREEQILLGQFYTPSRVADVLVAWTIDPGSNAILDPGCGSGTFLLRAYDFLQVLRDLKHPELLERLWGFDLSPFATELAAINLFRQDLSSFNNFPRIVPGDFFVRRPGDLVVFPPARSGGVESVNLPIPQFDAIVGNPPYLRSQNQDDLDPQYKRRLFDAAARNGISAASKSDLFAFFVYKALDFLKPGSRLGFVTSASWLTAAFGTSLQKLFLERLKLVAVMGSMAESFFPQVDVNAVLLIAEIAEVEGKSRGSDLIRFAMLKRRLGDLFPPGDRYWFDILELSDRIESSTESWEDNTVRVHVVNAVQERAALNADPSRPRNWSVYLRAPLSYFDLFGDRM